MSKLTARELRVIAHYGFPMRLDAVLTATLAYQGAHNALKHAHDQLDGALETVAAAEELQSVLPADLALGALAELQHAEARARLAKAADALRGKTEQFFEAVGAAAASVLDLLEEHRYLLDRESLVKGLEAPIAAA